MRIEDVLEKRLPLPVPLKIGENSFSEIVIREVVGLDEEAISVPKFKNDHAGLMHELIHRCIQEVPGSDTYPTVKELRKLPVAVLDMILIEIRKLSVGDDYELVSVCPNKKCAKGYEETVSMDSLGDVSTGNFALRKVKLPRGVTVKGEKQNEVTIRPVDGDAQSQFTKADIDEFGMLNTDLIHSCIVRLGKETPSKDVVSHMTRMDRKFISDVISSFPSFKTTHVCSCPKCNERWKVSINVLDFLA